nr:uncharacterized protein LOC125968620 [Syngnathus scovelli]
MGEGRVEGRADGILRGPLGTVRKLERVNGGGENGLDVLHDQPLKALHDDGRQCHRAVVIEAGRCRFLRHRNDGGSLETRGDDGLLQGNVKDVREDTRQLPSAVLQRSTRDVVRARRLTGVNSGKRPPHTVGREAQGLLVWGGSGLQRASAVLGVEASKEAVQIVQQTDVALTAPRRGLVVRDGLNAPPKATCVLAVLEVGGDLARERLLRFFDASGQSEDSPRQPRLPVRASDDGFRASHIIDALRDVRGNRVSILLYVRPIVVGGCLLKQVPVSGVEAVTKCIGGTLRPHSNLPPNRPGCLYQLSVCGQNAFEG